MSKTLDFMDYIENLVDAHLPRALCFYVGEQERQGHHYLVYRLDYMALNRFRFQQRKARQQIEYFRKLIGPHLCEERVGYVILTIPVR